MNNSGIFGLSSNSSVTINGKTYVGSNITINGNKVSVDGNVVEEAVNIYINVTGNVEKINTTGDIEVHGNVGSAKTGAGDIDIIGDVSGDVETGAGDIVIKGNVAGNVETGAGSIHHGR